MPGVSVLQQAANNSNDPRILHFLTSEALHMLLVEASDGYAPLGILEIDNTDRSNHAALLSLLRSRARHRAQHHAVPRAERC